MWELTSFWFSLNKNSIVPKNIIWRLTNSPTATIHYYTFWYYLLFPSSHSLLDFPFVLFYLLFVFFFPVALVAFRFVSSLVGVSSCLFVRQQWRWWWWWCRWCEGKCVVGKSNYTVNTHTHTNTHARRSRLLGDDITETYFYSVYSKSYARPVLYTIHKTEGSLYFRDNNFRHTVHSFFFVYIRMSSISVILLFCTLLCFTSFRGVFIFLLPFLVAAFFSPFFPAPAVIRLRFLRRLILCAVCLWWMVFVGWQVADTCVPSRRPQNYSPVPFICFIWAAVLLLSEYRSL